jgi:NAD(P)-dependent dehydrogenase (short-subunit alcohol dehydrogenase family)
MLRLLGMIDFAGRVAVVTGGGRGLGRSYALELARRGASVIVNDPGVDPQGRGRDDSVAESVVAEITNAGGRAEADRHSVATPTGGEAIVAAAVDTYGRLDIVINNAGVLLVNLLTDLTPEELEAHLDVHVKGSMYVSRPAFQVMKDQQYGRMVFMGSMAGMFGMPGLAAYGTAKGAIFGLANAVATEGVPYGILANVVLPVGLSRMSNAWRGDVRAKAGHPPLDPYSDDDIDLADHSVSTAAVTYLASQNCTINHHVFSTAGGRIASVFVGVTPGWRKSGGTSADDVAAHLDEIVDRSAYSIPMSAMEENELAQIKPQRNVVT